jgi:ABC-type nitrate/sulfonate/bicarbonate transport system substrate-binding protein
MSNTKCKAIFKLFFVALTIFVGIWLISSCSSKSKVTGHKHIVLKIDWTPEPTYYGIFYAKAKGLYRKAGFDVEITYGKGAPSLANEIGLGKVLVGTTSSDNILMQVAMGRKFSLCVPLLRFNPFAILSLKEKPILKLSDLKGKKLGVNVESVTYIQYLNALKKASIDSSSITEIPVGWGGTDFLIDHKVDAILGYITNHGVDLQSRGQDFLSILYSDLNPPLYSFGLVLAFAKSNSKDSLTEYEMYKIAKATLSGYEQGIEDKTEAARIMKNVEPSLSEEKIIYGISRIEQLNLASHTDSSNIDIWKDGKITPQDRQIARSLYKYNDLAREYDSDQ